VIEISLAEPFLGGDLTENFYMIIPVILSGGSGTRLWPMSRAERPKQLLPLTGTETMLQLTARRTMAQTGFASPIIVANAAHADEIENQLNAVGIDDAVIILEPAARNTAPAIALAALAADRSAQLLIMPSDHVIENVDAFMAAVAAAVPLCADGWFITFGITPDAPETGYGYIRRGEELAPGVNKVERFVEKPDVETARSYLASGDYSWNGGIFLFTAGTYLEALARLEPAMLAAATEGMEKARRDGHRIFPGREGVRRLPQRIGRLCRDGKGRPRGRGARRHGLVRSRQLGRAACHRAERRRQ
jgi:mannose-1-phosphate guanylyltransferase/mannose-1-phosphate guanylyltransferase/mannose-6-phosphate isomerase